MLSAEDLRLEHALSAGILAAVLFTVPILVGMVVEPFALAVSERFDRRKALVACLVFLSAAEVGVVLAPGPVTLSAAIALWGIGVGVATTLAEVALVATHRGATEAILARWALWGVLGDLAAPLLFGGAAAVGLGWRWVVLAGAVVSLVDAALVAGGPSLETAEPDEEEEVPIRVALAALARRPAVWAWLLAATLCSLFDETFVVFGTLWLRATGLHASAQGAAFVAFAVGGVVGLKAIGRLAPTVHGQLVWASAGVLVAFPLWLAAPPALAVPATALLGATAVPLWPLCTARAYDQGRPALVAALAQVVGTLDLLLPVLIGHVADGHGLLVALCLLLAQPVGILAVVAWAERRGRRTGEG